jgi:hypothetical protein
VKINRLSKGRLILAKPQNTHESTKIWHQSIKISTFFELYSEAGKHRKKGQMLIALCKGSAFVCFKNHNLKKSAKRV